ncbi:MAG: sensor histidine kinase [Ferruginibacter sp.]
MFNTDTQSVVIFIVACTLLILLLTSFITFIIYKYQQKQNSYFQSLEEMKAIHENDMLKSKLEIQEQTFANISREIHDNIGQKLTLAKLHLNTLNFRQTKDIDKRINESVNIIGEAINDLSDISRSMSSEIILNNGFIKALEFEVNQLNKPGLYRIKLIVTGESVFLEANKELILFRITQEALNNIVKHAEATEICIRLHYQTKILKLEITDNGKGFTNKNKDSNGLINMDKRAKMVGGRCDIASVIGNGTTIKIEIPLYENDKVI